MTGAVYIAILFMLMLIASFGTVGSLFVLYIKDLYRLEAVTPIALAFAISSGVSIIAMVFVGYLYDRYGITVPASIAVVSMALWALLMNAMSRFSSWDKAYLLWYSGGVFQGISMASIMISVNPTLMMLFPSRKGLAVSVPQSAQALAMAFWSYTAVYLMQMLGFFNALTVMGLAGSASIALVAVVLRRIGGNIGRGLDSRSEKNKSSIGTMFIAKDAKVKLAVVYTMILFIALSSIVIMSFLAGIIEEPFVIAIGDPSYTEHIRTVVVPKIMMFTGFAQTLSAILWGYAIDRFGVPKIIPTIYALETISTAVAYTMYRVNPWAVAGFVILRYVFFSAEPVAHWVLIPTIFGVENLGRISGIVNSAPMLASLVAPVLAGSIKDVIGSYSYILLISSLLSVASLAVYVYLRRMLKKKQSAISTL